jgi:pyruvate formate lyase activating enzyme
MATDGNGVSTLIAFWGCPLHCKYCLNDQCHKREGVNETERGAYTPEELIKVVSKDDLYFKMTGGGIVFGGGEPLLQSDFIHEVCNLVDPAWHKRIETSLNVEWRDFKFLIDDIDEWIIDIKDMNPEIYKAYTGIENDRVIKNLSVLAEHVGKEHVVIRIPFIPKYNSKEDVEKSVALIQEIGFTNLDVFHYVIRENKYKNITG